MAEKMSARKQRRLEAAEEVCRAVRAGFAHATTQQHYLNVALEWLLVWMDNAPKGVKYLQPNIPPRRRPAPAPPISSQLDPYTYEEITGEEAPRG